jgi:NAD(P)-dependent dehydrogenase (short-subunit alcohol dehydrogenase family)
MRIENSIVLITGGASGIGEAMTRYYVEKGAKIVYICDVQEEKGKKLEFEFKSKVKFIKCDITNDESVKSMIDTIKNEEGKLDIVINSAGIGSADLLATEKSIHRNDVFDKVLKVNTYGSFLVSKYAAKLMIEKSDPNSDCNGVIIMIASVAAYEGQKGQTAYSASKGALVGMALPMARDLGKFKIRVNAIAPGVIETPMIQGFRATKVGKGILENTPLKTFGKPLHICQASDFIVNCDFVNGTTIRVDGGGRLPHF